MGVREEDTELDDGNIEELAKVVQDWAFGRGGASNWSFRTKFRQPLRLLPTVMEDSRLEAPGGQVYDDVSPGEG